MSGTKSFPVLCSDVDRLLLRFFVSFESDFFYLITLVLRSSVWYLKNKEPACFISYYENVNNHSICIYIYTYILFYISPIKVYVRDTC